VPRHERALTAAVVGAGTGGMLSARALMASDRYDLVAIVDISPEALERASHDVCSVKTFRGHREMLEEVHPDVVCISTFPTSHAAVMRDALAANVKGALLEKPITARWSEASELIRDVKYAQCPIVVPHGLFVSGASSTLLRRILAGEIGEVELIEIECSGWDILSAGVHWISFALAALGGEGIRQVLTACDAGTQTFRDGIQVETEAVTLAEAERGARIVMQTGDNVRLSRGGKQVVLRIYGSEGSAEFWGFEDQYMIRPRGEVTVSISRERDQVSVHQAYLESLAEMIKNGASDYEVPELSLRALEVCEAAYVSNRHRCVVQLPLSDFKPPAEVTWDPGAAYAGNGGRNGRSL
jgi:predicted dehydrogenase